jgi:DNA-binding response OmpR family regulator
VSAPATILVVDDQPELLDNLGQMLESAGHRTIQANNGVEALARLQSEPVDLIVSDIAMPGMNGYQLYERVRENPAWLAIPFLFLTARDLDSDVRYGKELGADDYLIKPVCLEDLVAAVRGRLKRAQQLRQQAPAPGLGQRAFSVGLLQIDPGQHRAWMSGQPVQLSAREFTLLEHLARQAGRVVSAQELIRVTHDMDTDALEAGTLLRPLIRSLRRKLGYPVDEMGCIENVRGVGYRLIAPGA